MVVVAYQLHFILILLHYSWTSRHLTRPIDLPMVFMVVTEFYVLVKQSKMSALLFIPVDPQHYDCLCNGSRRCATTDIIALISHVQSHSLLFLLMAPGKHCSGEPVFSEPNPCVRQVVLNTRVNLVWKPICDTYTKNSQNCIKWMFPSLWQQVYFYRTSGLTIFSYV